MARQAKTKKMLAMPMLVTTQPEIQAKLLHGSSANSGAQGAEL